MAVTTKQIAWVAGLLEGEASFGMTNNSRNPAIWLSMTDYDTIEKAKNIIDSSLRITVTSDKRKESYKDIYRITINGITAIGWMMTIYDMMSVRRKDKIKFCIEAWKSVELNQSQIRSKESGASRGLMFSYGMKLRRLGYNDTQVEMAFSFKKLDFPDDEILKLLGNIKSN